MDKVWSQVGFGQKPGGFSIGRFRRRPGLWRVRRHQNVDEDCSSRQGGSCGQEEHRSSRSSSTAGSPIRRCVWTGHRVALGVKPVRGVTDAAEPVEARLDREPDKGGRLAVPDPAKVSGRKLSTKEEARGGDGRGVSRALEPGSRRADARRGSGRAGPAGMAEDDAGAAGPRSVAARDAAEDGAAFRAADEVVSDKLLAATRRSCRSFSVGCRRRSPRRRPPIKRPRRRWASSARRWIASRARWSEMVDSSKTQADAADRPGAGSRAVGRSRRQGDAGEPTSLLEQNQREGSRAHRDGDGSRDSTPCGGQQDEHVERLGKLVSDNGRWTQLLVVLLSLTFFAIAGILAVLALS